MATLKKLPPKPVPAEFSIELNQKELQALHDLLQAGVAETTLDKMGLIDLLHTLDMSPDLEHSFSSNRIGAWKSVGVLR